MESGAREKSLGGRLTLPRGRGTTRLQLATARGAQSPVAPSHARPGSPVRPGEGAETEKHMSTNARTPRTPKRAAEIAIEQLGAKAPFTDLLDLADEYNPFDYIESYKDACEWSEDAADYLSELAE
jgi:hypothetical protein